MRSSIREILPMLRRERSWTCEDFCYEIAVKLYEKYGSEIFKDIFNEFE